MPVYGTSTLIEYESKRQSERFIPYVSDISDVGESKVKLVTISGLPSNPRFDLIVQSKNLSVGNGDFFVVGTRMDPEHVYRYLTIDDLASLKVDKRLIVTGHPEPNDRTVDGKVVCHGRLELGEGSSLELIDHGQVIVETGGTLYFHRGSRLELGGGQLTVKGCVYLPVEMIDQFTSLPGVTLEPMSTVKVAELPGARAFSLTDYLVELKSSYHPVGTGAARSMSAGNAQASYHVISGEVSQPSQVLELTVDRGEVILGDLDLEVNGQPKELKPFDRLVNSITVTKGSQLSIRTDFMGDTYYHPRLKLNRTFSGSSSPKLIVDGRVDVADGSSSILLTGGEIIISAGGELVLRNGGRLEHTDGQSTVVIDGRLIVDDLDCLGSRNPRNYVFGPEGKLIVRNPSPINDWERKPLLSIPNGFRSSLLATLFGDRLDRVEFHLTKNCGLVIDTDMSPFHRWSDWYNGARLERAIREGWLIWHSGAYLGVDRSVLPWLSVTEGLGQLTKLFKSYRSTEKERLQDLVDRLIFAGCGDLVFRVTDDENSLAAETMLRLGGCELLAASYNPLDGSYGVTADSDGELYLVSPATGTEPEQLLVKYAKVEKIPPVTHRTTFRLP